LSLENISGSLTNDLEQDYKKFYSENFGQPIYNYLLYNYLSKKIDKHPNNRLYFDLLYSFSRRQKYLNYKQFLVLANILDMSNRTYYQKNRFFRNLQNAMYLGIGSQFPTANLFTTDGKTVNLKDQLGNVTLILISDYKSWTSLDIHEETLKLHEKYHPKGYNFLVVQLLDKDETPYLKTTDNTLGWINFYSSDLTDKLKLSWGGFQSIEYLVDDSGKIIAINLSTSELEKVLKSRL
jgi:hypothetical protein